MNTHSLRAGERKSIARYCQHFAPARTMTAAVYSFLNLVAPAALLVVLGLGAVALYPEIHHAHGHFSHQFPAVMGMAAAAPALSPELKTHLDKLETDLKSFMEKHADEVKTNGTASVETKAALEKLGNDWKETSARLLTIEQKLTAPNGGRNGAEEKSIGELFATSEQFKTMMQRGDRGSGQVKVGSFHKTNVVNATGQNQPLVQSVRITGPIIPGGLQRLTVRDLLPQIPTTGNLIEFPKETAFTNNAGIQANEGDAKPESALTFTLSTAAVKTLAHFIPASRQILEDAPALQAYINSRLLYGLKYYEEQQLLNGTGSGSTISGLVANATTFDTTRVTVATDNYADVISHALQQVRDGSQLEPTGIILNSRDLETIRLMKSTTGEYLGGGPFGPNVETIWGKPVVGTPSMASSQFLVGAFQPAAAIYDRDDATVEISREHSDFFVRNLVAILAEERLALAIYRPLAIVYGGFPFGS